MVPLLDLWKGFCALRQHVVCSPQLHPTVDKNLGGDLSPEVHCSSGVRWREKRSSPRTQAKLFLPAEPWLQPPSLEASLQTQGLQPG